MSIEKRRRLAGLVAGDANQIGANIVEFLSQMGALHA
jgi:hypothetical protein